MGERGIGAGATGAGAGAVGSTMAGGTGREATGLGISRSCQFDMGSGLKVDAAGMVPKSIDAAGLAGEAVGVTVAGAGEVAATGAETG